LIAVNIGYQIVIAVSFALGGGAKTALFNSTVERCKKQILQYGFVETARLPPINKLFDFLFIK